MAVRNIPGMPRQRVTTQGGHTPQDTLDRLKRKARQKALTTGQDYFKVLERMKAEMSKHRILPDDKLPRADD